VPAVFSNSRAVLIQENIYIAFQRPLTYMRKTAVPIIIYNVHSESHGNNKSSIKELDSVLCHSFVYFATKNIYRHFVVIIRKNMNVVSLT
jgi:hypothetical protein